MEKSKLATIDIDVEDSPPVSQNHTLPLKHAAWLQKELELLGKAITIVRSVSLWAIPIVEVSKKSQPCELPRRGLCVSHRVQNNLLPPVKKAHSKAKCTDSCTFARN